MKTTNFVRIAFRIVMQSLVPMILLELVIIILFGSIDTAPNLTTYIGHATTRYNTVAIGLAGSTVALFGIWFHFISEHRFKNRRPKGLYREYINWFMDQET